MKLLVSYIPFQLLMGVFLGILFPQGSLRFLVVYLLVIIVLMFLLHRFMMHKYFSHLFYFILICMFGMCMSWFSQLYNNDLSKESHYFRFIDQSITAKLTICRQLKSTKVSERFYGKLHMINDTQVEGKVLIEFPLSVENDLKVGDVFVCKTTLRSINAPVSPYDFDYKRYLIRQHVYAKIKLEGRYVKLGEDNSLLVTLQKFRSSLSKTLEESNLSTNTVVLMKAMLLGDKSSVTQEIKTSFTDSGVVHIIAISGMHIGILYFVLLFTFGFVKRLKYGNYVYVCMVLICLWSFAVFSGLSSSVVRSVLMFSFFTLTKLKKGYRLVFEALVTSMLILLLFDSNYIFDIGFQLSYFAVISIVTFYPLFSKHVTLKIKVILYFVDILLVSFVAQLGVLGLTLFYFHQVPLHFLLTNFFAVSLLPVVLYGGILVLIKVIINVQSVHLEVWYDNFISFYLQVIQFFSSLSQWILKDVEIRITHVLSYYVLLYGVWYLANSISYKKITHFFCLCIVCQLMFIVETIYTKEELLLYNNYGPSLVTVQTAKKLRIFGKSILNHKDSLLLKENRFQNNIEELICDTNEVFAFKGVTYLMVNKTKSYDLLSKKGMVFIISNNPKINMERMIISLRPKTIIIDNSNYKYHQVKWIDTCEKFNIPFYIISDQGAYRMG
jgi:competence protein ComEC